MYEKQEDVFYYITVMNENYPMPAMPEGCKDGILRGMYKFKKSQKKSALKVHLLGSGAIMNEVLKAQEVLENDYKVSADVWSVTSYKQLRLDGMETERWNLLNPDKNPKLSYLQELTKDETGIFVSASDYVQMIGDSISKWLPSPLITLGTYGFGRSDGRDELRDFFEVDYKYIVLASLSGLVKNGKIKADVLKKAISELNINPNKPNPLKD